MVVGIENFKKHFADFADQYTLIGGTACSLIMDEVGLDFRATKDLDIVLYIEVLDEAFLSAFWEFVRAGGYSNRQHSTGKAVFYRFSSPTVEDFPFMLELFSRTPTHILLQKEGHLTPIAINKSIVSLSAILLNDDYYHFIKQRRLEMSGLPIVSPECLIALKARAWLDITARAQGGQQVNKRDIKKHKNDILRLSQLISPKERIPTPQSIQEDILHFLEALELDPDFNLRQLSIRNTTKSQIINLLKEVFEIQEFVSG